MERQAAVAAMFEVRSFHPEPMAASGAVGIEALNGPAGQILHPPSRVARGVRESCALRKPRPTKKVGRIVRAGL
jgi:hypothetical protein